jgi:hypothetical protein
VRILAADISSVFRRAWEAGHDDAFSVARSRAVNKVLRAAEGFDRIVIARDPPQEMPDKTPCAPFRKAIHDGYKADRVDPGEGYRQQLRNTVDELKLRGALSFVSPRLQMQVDPGFACFGEADDVLASLAMWYQETRGEDWALRILTGDTDLWALVDDQLAIDVVDLDGKIVTADTVIERYGVAPHLVPEIKALSGDGSDKYFPFRHPEKTEDGKAKAGIGDGTAAKIVIASDGRAEGDLSGADGVIRAVIEGRDPGLKLTAPVVLCLKHHGKAGLIFGRQMAYMRPDLPIDFSPVLDEPRRAPQKPAAPEVPVEMVPPKEERAPSTSTALAVPQSAAAVISSPGPYSLEPADMGQAMKLAKWMDESGMFRKSLGSPAACLMVVGIARSLGIPVFLAAQHAFMVHGRLDWSAVFKIAVVRKHKDTRRFQFDPKRCDSRRATLMYQRAGAYAANGEYVVTIEDARDAGFLDGKHSDQWKRRPQVMLQWFAARECARVYWGDVIWGMNAPDDIEHESLVDEPGEFPPGMTEET